MKGVLTTWRERDLKIRGGKSIELVKGSDVKKGSLAGSEGGCHRNVFLQDMKRE